MVTAGPVCPFHRCKEHLGNVDKLPIIKGAMLNDIAPKEANHTGLLFTLKSKGTNGIFFLVLVIDDLNCL